MIVSVFYRISIVMDKIRYVSLLCTGARISIAVLEVTKDLMDPVLDLWRIERRATGFPFIDERLCLVLRLWIKPRCLFHSMRQRHAAAVLRPSSQIGLNMVLVRWVLWRIQEIALAIADDLRVSACLAGRMRAWGSFCRAWGLVSSVTVLQNKTKVLLDSRLTVREFMPDEREGIRPLLDLLLDHVGPTVGRISLDAQPHRGP